jgi:DNA-binding response OmpR family regulator
MSDILLLLIEDEPLQLMELAQSLEEAGYKVLTAFTGAKALVLLNTEATRLSGVITDIRLGTGPNGWQVGQRARELIPTMPVVYVSGDSKSEWAAQGVPNSLLIEKPFAMAQIITAISQLINASQQPQ